MARGRSLRLSRCVLAFVVAIVLGAVSARAGQGDVWTPIGPDVASVLSLAVAPNGTLYAAASERGVFRSDNGGARWESFHPRETLAVARQVVVDPGNPRTVYARAERDIFRSTNGHDWVGVGPFRGATFAQVFALAPSDPDRLYFLEGSSIGVSRDGGTTWEGFTGPFLVAESVLLVDPRNADVLYASDTLGPLLKSTDGGHSWHSGTPAGGGAAIFFVYSLALAPGHPDVQYAGTQGSGIWKTIDGGETWKPALPLAGLGSVVTALAVDPRKPSRIYAGIDRFIANEVPARGEIWRSEDAGATWSKLFTSPTAPILRLAVSPLDPRTVYAGFDRSGVWKSTDRGATWRPARRGLQAYTVREVAADPHHPGSLWLAAPELSVTFFALFGDAGKYPGILHTADGGKSWASADAQVGQAALSTAGIVFDPAREGRLWLFGERLLLASADGGASWEDETLPIIELSTTALAIDPAAPDTMYAAGRLHGELDLPALWKTDDAGASWRELSGAFDLGLGIGGEGTMTSVLVNPSRPATVYARGTNGFFRSRDGGERWVRLGSGLPRGAPVTPTVIDPFAPNVLYTFSSDPERPIWKSTDFGAHWQATSLALPHFTVWTDLLADTHRRGTLYAAGFDGVFVTDDGGTSWRPLDDGLPAGTWVLSLAADPNVPGRIYAGVRGAGLFALTRRRAE